MCGVLEFHSMLRLFFNLQKGLYNFFPDNVAAGSFFNLIYLGGGGGEFESNKIFILRESVLHRKSSTLTDCGILFFTIEEEEILWCDEFNDPDVMSIISTESLSHKHLFTMLILLLQCGINVDLCFLENSR